MTRFLAGRPRLVYEYKFQGEQQMPTAYSDASWASNASDRRSTSGGVLMHGSHCIKSWSKTPSLVALSSAESELYATMKASAEAMGFQSVIRDLVTIVDHGRVQRRQRSLGVIQRQGLGRLRHLDGNFLLVQSLVARKVVQYTKVLGSDILADMCSSGLNVELMTRYVSAVMANTVQEDQRCAQKSLEYRIHCETALGRGTRLSSAVC